MPESLSLKSPLQRRIARHASLATIFRQPTDSGASGIGSQLPTSGKISDRPSSQFTLPVKAHLLPVGSRLPEAILLPRLPLAGELPADWDDEQLPPVSPPTSPPTAKTMPIQTAPSTAEPSAQPSIIPPAALENTGPAAAPAQPALPAAGQDAGLDDEDRNWRRLQTIFRRHQEREQVEQTAGDQPRPASPPAERPGDPLTAQTSPTQAAKPVETAGKAEIPARPDSIPPESPVETQLPAAGTPAEAPIQSRPAGPAPASSRPQPPARLEPSAPQAASAESQSPQTGVHPAAETPPSPAQKLPLEAVWPVQRAPHEPAPGRIGEEEKIQASATQPQAPVQETFKPVPSSAPAPAPAPAAADDEAQAKSLAHLQQARTRQPSASSIEVLVPRRPHPLRPTAASPEASVPGPQPQAAHEQPAAEPETQIQTKKEPAKPEMSSPQSGIDRPEPAPDRQVQTEIGPLPEDLWRLLGEEPPPAEDDTAPMSATGSPAESHQAAEAESGLQGTGAAAQTAGQTAALQRAIAAAESRPTETGRPTETRRPTQPGPGSQTPSRPLSPDPPLNNVLPPIQRAAAPGSPARSEASAASGRDQDLKTDQPTEAELDLDELARQVYGQVRRRLNLEFERLHRRK